MDLRAADIWDGRTEPAGARRLAALAWQLPRDSRTWSAIDPMGANGTLLAIVRQLEHDVRMFQWSFTDKAKDESTAPEPISLPGEDEAWERAEEEADRAALDLAETFGLKL